MTTKEKVVNFTEAQETALRAAYVSALEAGQSYDEVKASVVDKFAEQFGKSAKSIVAKLSRMGVYKAKEYVSKTGEKPQKKDDTATAIGAILRLSEADTDSLAKANKKALSAVMSALANSVPIDPETPEESMSKADSLTKIQSVISLDADGVQSLKRVKASVLETIAVFLTASAD